MNPLNYQRNDVESCKNRQVLRKPSSSCCEIDRVLRKTSSSCCEIDRVLRKTSSSRSFNTDEPEYPHTQQQVQQRKGNYIEGFRAFSAIVLLQYELTPSVMMRVKFCLLVTCLALTSLETSLTTAIKDPTSTDFRRFV
ncbi:hypothetical protein LSAT2_020416 [Lamellibrachia satsuma]|nr:hypothetical protein LSAT2_020416 [Lamellibrachia satsuma]